MQKEVLQTGGENLSSQNYTGWDESIFQKLTNAGKKAYLIAAKLHDKVVRKDGSWYLKHINRSLKFYHRNKSLFGTSFDANNIERNICLHDCIEDSSDGLYDIEKDFGDDVVIRTLWMSELNTTVRSVLPFFVSNLPEYRREQYNLFIQLSQLIEKYNGKYYAQDDSELRGLLPNGNWRNQWKNYFSGRYDSEKDPQKKKDIYAEWIFQGTLWNMPDDCFLAKSCERVDNLGDTVGLNNEKGRISYQNTVKTTNITYIPRLNELKYASLSHRMNIVAGEGKRKLSHFPTRASLITSSVLPSSSAPQISS